MLTILPKMNVYSVTPLKRGVKSFAGNDISDLISKGNKALNENKFQEALSYYLQANSKEPDDISVYRKLAKAYSALKDYSGAEKNFNIYLKENPNDSECLIELGEVQRMSGYYQKALASFESAYSLDKTNDLARRKILETKNNQLSVFNPIQAQSQKTEYASKNLKQALNMTVKYMGTDYMKALSDVTICFGPTASMGGTANIAQWENRKNSVTVSDSYIYAAPQVIAAYLTHESIHAHDKDPYTSVREEQDAYEAAAKFWIKNSNGVKDPEMDYAADLYKQSPSALKARVREIYELRDPSIAKTSPNHPPSKLFRINSSKKKAASTTIKQYDVIA